MADNQMSLMTPYDVQALVQYRAALKAYNDACQARFRALGDLQRAERIMQSTFKDFRVSRVPTPQDNTMTNALDEEEVSRER